MPLYDFQCRDCKVIFERFAKREHRTCECPHCGSQHAARIISIGKSAYRVDAPWIRTVLDVVDKTDKDPATRAFLAEPTREHYDAWMKAKGLRPMTEKEYRQPDVDKAVEAAIRDRSNMILRQKRKRETINLRGN